MLWSDFKTDLLYDYTRFLLKSLNNHEVFFMKSLRNQTDNVIKESLEWVDENMDLLTSFHDSSDWLDYYYDESMIEMILISLIGAIDTTPMIKDFYGTGARIGYNHMGVDYGFYDSDTKALSSLTDYVNTVDKSIQSEIAYGVINTVGEHIDNGSLDSVKEDIVNIPYSKVEHHITPDTRTLFMVKTEYARSVNTGLLQSYSNYGVDNYDWVTSGLPNTCNRCYEIESNSPYTLMEVNSLLCPHVNCVCSVKARLPKILSLQDNPLVVDLTPSTKK